MCLDFLGILFGYKGIVLIFGLFLAYETRSIKVKGINDSRLVGMSIYNVVVLCLITAPVTMVIASQQDAGYAFVIEILRHPGEKEGRDGSAPSDGGMTREEEERYRSLLAENDELQKLISAKEEKIRLLKQRLEEKEAVDGGGRSKQRHGRRRHADSSAGAASAEGAAEGPLGGGAALVVDEGNSDSAVGLGLSSVYTGSSRASRSDFEFSESYL
ncbi:hypothetical protein J437_LFUL013728 [Ladona fulva]|uniref:G-protein coupled receptors family 3 profile domain-containing protein n=1 Tax=Ladona fulva TaxID=123851 RepID=A0A8K0KLF7_LADFU|nr:hypothetical protein J437_LFUL013728 [Ladona fulva]